jgi:hypothetical protein
MVENKSPAKGWKTSEFWGTVAVFLMCALTQSGLIGSGSINENVASVLGSVAAALGYGSFRASVKNQFARGNVSSDPGISSITVRAESNAEK